MNRLHLLHKWKEMRIHSRQKMGNLPDLLRQTCNILRRSRDTHSCFGICGFYVGKRRLLGTRLYCSTRFGFSYAVLRSLAASAWAPWVSSLVRIAKLYSFT